MKFLIVSPRQRSGGSIVLHKLCYYLEKHGHEAKILLICRGCFNNKNTISSWLIWFSYNFLNTVACSAYKLTKSISNGRYALFSKFFYEPVRGIKYCYNPITPSDAIVVYPEIIYGNPLHGKKVVRWLLYYNKFSGIDEAFDKDDLVFCYRDIFNDVKLNPEGRRLGMGHFDFAIYKQTNFQPREGSCYILRKGKHRPDIPINLDGPVIDDLSEEEKVKVFNKCKYCYLYDTQTFYATIAAVCGAIPIIVPEAGKSRRDYLGDGDVAYGVAYGDSEEEINYALQTRDLCIKGLQDVEKWSDRQAMDFIAACKDYFQ